VRDRILRRAAASCSTAFFANSVRIVPGPTPLTRMRCGASAIAITLVNWFTPPFETT